MTRTIALTMLLALNYGYAQTAAKAPAFEVASITPCPPGTPEPAMEHTGMAQFTAPGGRFRASATTLKFLVEWAYGIQPFQHSDGPSWMGTDRYDIVAKGDENATEEQMKVMVQTLLAERFKLKLHHESKKLSVYVISVGKTAPKLFPAKDGEIHGLGFAPQTGPDQKVVSYRAKFTRFTLAQLGDAFGRQLERAMVNQTGLSGEYDFTVDITPDDSRPNPMDPTLLITALREQLGLTVKVQDAPVDFLAIESAEKVAAGN